MKLNRVFIFVLFLKNGWFYSCVRNYLNNKAIKNKAIKLLHIMGIGVHFIKYGYDNEVIKANPIKQTHANKCMWTKGSHCKKAQKQVKR